MRVGKLIALGILLIIGVSFLLWFAKPQQTWSIIIQADAIITLILVTLYYAIQTQKMVKQEKISLDEEKKRRSVDFWQSRLTEFFIPLKINLLKWQTVMKFKPFSVGEHLKTLSEFIEIMSKAYMLTAEMSNSLISFMNMFKFQKRDKVEEAEKYEIIEKTEELLKKGIFSCILVDIFRLNRNSYI